MKKMKLRFLALLLAGLVGMNGIPLEAFAAETVSEKAVVEDVSSGDVGDGNDQLELVESSVDVSVGDAHPANIAAQERVWALINEYADPEYHLSDLFWDGKGPAWHGTLTEEQYQELTQVAQSVTAECETQYDKIKAIVEYVSDSIYYDYYYIDGYGPTYYNPYDVYTQKRTVCEGYSNLVKTLLGTIDIPCMQLNGELHAYNAAYDSENDRWIFADATWCSQNEYTVEQGWEKRQYTLSYFDLEPKEIAKLPNHEVYEVDGLVDPESGDFYYMLNANDEDWIAMDWHLSVSDFRKEGHLTAGDGFADLQVKDIGYLVYLNQTGNNTVTAIDLSATDVEEVHLSGWTALEGIVLPETVKNVWFTGCSALKAIDLSHTRITALDYTAFEECTSLEKVILPTAMKTIGQRAFMSCKALKDVNLSQTQIETIETRAFFGCSKLEKVELPATVTEIADYAFDGCTGVKILDFSKTGITKLGSDNIPFLYLEVLKLPATITSAASNAVSKYQREGYYDSWWNTAADGSGTSYDTIQEIVNVIVASGSGITLYPQWQAEGYYINYVLSGGENNANNPSLGYYDKTVVLADPTRTGFTFDGWYSDSTYTTRVTQIEAGNRKSVTLYAKWVPKQYAITYKLNGGKNHKSNPTGYTGETSTITLKKPTRTGYTFAGWYSDKNFKNKVTGIKQGSTGNKTLYAKWTVNKYNIKFAGNGATSGKMSTLTNRKYNTSYKLSANKYTRKGYTFAGWNTKKDGSGKSYSNNERIKNLSSANGKTITLYAQWKPVKYTITYKLNGGKNNSKNPKSYTAETKTITLKKPTKKGYTFEGWYSDKKLTKKVTRIKKGSTGKITLYAKWKKAGTVKTYPVTHDY